MAITIHIKDEVTASKWLAEVEEINQDYDRAMQAAGECLRDMNEFGEGTMIDEFVGFADKMLTASKAIFGAMSEIAQSVNEVIKHARDLTSSVSDILKATVNKILK